MGWIRGFTQIFWFFVAIQGINGAAPGVNNFSDYEDVKTIGDYDDLRFASGFKINVQKGWDIKENFCRLLAHTSSLLDDKTIVIDSGMTKFKVPDDNNDDHYLEVPDFNGALVSLDLTKDFEVDDVQFMTVRRREEGDGGKDSFVPVANRGYMWQDSLGFIYIGGGHFFSQKWPQNWTHWEHSRFYLEKKKIPEYSLWRYDINNNKWDKVLFPPETQPQLRRLASSGYISIPSINMSYAFGGYQSNRTGPNTAEDQMWATNGLVTYDHSTNTVQNISDPQDYGYTHAVMHHLGPFDNQQHQGLLLILPGKYYNLSDNFIENDRFGESYDFTQIKFYDLKTGEWYTQQASYFENQRPVSRTRFCSVLVSEEGKWGWDLWIYGGQSSENPNQLEPGLVSDIWVLKMPAFMWIKITNPEDHDLRRAHTCHAVGNHMVVLGGYPPGRNVDPTAPCDKRLVKLFDFSSRSWVTQFKAGTKYVPPSQVSEVQPPIGKEWGDTRLQALLDPPTTSTKIDRKGAIIGGTLGGVILLFCVCGFWFRKKILTFIRPKKPKVEGGHAIA